MRNRIAAIVVAALALTVLAACESDKTSSSSSSAPASHSSDTSWVADAVTATQDMQSVMGQVSVAATGGDTSGAINACDAASGHTDAWKKAFAAVPLADVKAASLEAVSDYDSAFSSCASGDFTTATTYITLGNAKIQEAIAAIPN